MDVRAIFKESYQLYGLYRQEELFQAITENLTKAPQELVPGIMADTYNFYVKWDGQKDNVEFDWGQMRTDSIELTHKYNNCDLCRKVLLALMNIIEQEFIPGGNREKE